MKLHSKWPANCYHAADLKLYGPIYLLIREVRTEPGWQVASRR